jgi:hypothetical protein
VAGRSGSTGLGSPGVPGVAETECTFAEHYDVRVTYEVRLIVCKGCHCATKSFVIFDLVAGTTGLEPATSAVTVSLKPVTYRNNGQWVAPLDPKRNVEESILWPYCAHIVGPICYRDLCRPAASAFALKLRCFPAKMLPMKWPLTDARQCIGDFALIESTTDLDGVFVTDQRYCVPNSADRKATDPPMMVRTLCVAGRGA